MKIFCLRIPLH